MVPLKRVLDEVGVSRATLWRALKSNIEGMPGPTMMRGRVFWKRSEIGAVDDALGAFGGRGAFERARRSQRQRVEAERNRLSELKKSKRRRGRGAAGVNVAQADLFDK